MMMVYCWGAFISFGVTLGFYSKEKSIWGAFGRAFVVAILWPIVILMAIGLAMKESDEKR